MDRGGSLAPFSVAASAAETRAVDCRRRLADLERPDRVICGDDVLRARANLAAATARAAAAERRLDRARRHHELRQLMRRFHLSSAASVELPYPTGAGPLAPLRLKTFDWVSTGKVGLKPLWLGFISLGGECGILEFDAYLHGAWEMSERDRSVLEQVCWEYETFGSF